MYTQKTLIVLRIVFGIIFLALGIRIITLAFGSTFDPLTGFSTNSFEELSFAAILNFIIGCAEIVLFLMKAE